ncbi:MAG: hypothetical protein K6F88_07540 [Ruminococcus sp.]|nr:hypothetical protein [Ruminococcus sp.]
MMTEKQNTRVATEFAFVISAVIAILFFGKECSSGALRGIYFCAEVLVPSIFPFMVIAIFAAECGLSRQLGKITGGLCRKLFGVSGNLAAVLIMSMIGGYPVGARGIAALKKSGAISEDDAVRASYFAVGAGPGFLIVFVGQNLLSSVQTGVCILVSQILSIIILGIANKKFFGKTENYNSDIELKSKPLPFASALTEAVIEATYGMIDMCGMVVLFSAIIGLTEKFFGSANIYICILAEVTTASKLLADSGNILLLAFAVGFGGLCVHFQIFTALKSIEINKGLFFLYRIIQGVITALLTMLFIKIFNISLPVFSSISAPPELSLSTNAVGSAMLLLCGAGFIYTIKKL